MHLHEMESEIFAFPPGTTIAPNYSALSRDPRFPTIAKTRSGSSARPAPLKATWPTSASRPDLFAAGRGRATGAPGSPSRSASARWWRSR